MAHVGAATDESEVLGYDRGRQTAPTGDTPMKNRITLISILITVLLVGGWSLQQKAATPSYEYKILVVKLDASTEKKLNALGAEGWEIVSAQQPSAAGESLDVVTYHFKRSK